MAGWTGWAKDVLATLGAPETSANLKFLNDWETAEPTTCPFNPLSVKSIQPGSVRCHELSNGEYARAYTTKTIGLTATVEQLHNKLYTAILGALMSGDPFTFADPQKVTAELTNWAAHTFAPQYLAAATPAPSSGSGEQATAKVYLEGGPCDGKTVKVAASSVGLYPVTCKNHLYVVTDPIQHHNGATVYKDTGAIPPAPVPGVLVAPDALKGWKALRKSINKGMPETLNRAQRVNRETLRIIGKIRKVKV